MKIIFMGTPDFAVPCLKNLIESKHDVLAVVTQPDKKRNRGIISFSPVKECALQHGIPVIQSDKISVDGIENIRALQPDAIVTAAFGQMLSEEFLNIAPYGVINVHASLLPKYRGSSPIQWAIVNGEKETGITIMKTAYKMDSGDIILQKKTIINENESAGELFDRLAVIGASTLIDALNLIESGKAIYVKQNEEDATYFPMLKKEDGLIDFSKSPEQIKARVLGFNPWPSAYTFYNGKLLKIYKVSLADGTGNYGEVIRSDKKLIVAVGDGAVSLDIIQPENGKRMPIGDFLAGHIIEVGTVLGK